MGRDLLVQVDQFVDLGPGQIVAALDQLVELGPCRAVCDHERIDIHPGEFSSVRA